MLLVGRMHFVAGPAGPSPFCLVHVKIMQVHLPVSEKGQCLRPGFFKNALLMTLETEGVKC